MISRFVILVLLFQVAFLANGNAAASVRPGNASVTNDARNNEIYHFLTLVNHAQVNNLHPPATQHTGLGMELTAIEEEEQDDRGSASKKKAFPVRIRSGELLSGRHVPAAPSDVFEFGRSLMLSASSRLHLVIEVFRV